MHDAQVDFCSLDGEVLEIGLATPTFYEDCLNAVDWQEQVDCLTEACRSAARACEHPGVGTRGAPRWCGLSAAAGQINSLIALAQL